MSDEAIAGVLEAFPSGPNASALALVDNESLRRSLRLLDVPKPLMKKIVRELDLWEHKGELWSHFRGISHETKIAGRIASWIGSGAATIGHVTEFTEAQWSAVPQMGAKRIGAIAIALAEHGTSFGTLPLRDAELWQPAEPDAECTCSRRGRKPLGAKSRSTLYGQLRDRGLLRLVRCEQIGCIVHSRNETIDVIAVKLRYRMYSLTHAGEPGNIHHASLRRQ